MSDLFEQIKGIADVQNKAIMSGIELGRDESKTQIKELEAENERLRSEMSKISAECGRELKLVDKL